jgi:hypothetical protein
MHFNLPGSLDLLNQPLRPITNEQTNSMADNRKNSMMLTPNLISYTSFTQSYLWFIDQYRKVLNGNQELKLI